MYRIRHVILSAAREACVERENACARQHGVLSARISSVRRTTNFKIDWLLPANTYPYKTYQHTHFIQNTLSRSRKSQFFQTLHHPLKTLVSNVSSPKPFSKNPLSQVASLKFHDSYWPERT